VKAGAARAYLNLIVGDVAGSEEWLKRTIDLDLKNGPHPAPQQVLALVKVMARRGAGVEEALAAYRTLVGKAPDSGEARLTLAQLLASSGDQAGSLEQAGAAMDCDPNNVQIAYSVGMFLGQVGRPDLAAKALEHATVLDPTFAGAWMGLAYAKGQLGENAGGIAALREAVRVGPGNAENMRILAGALREAGQGDEASQLERRANELSPAQPGAEKRP
jgi:predicted Zn-dependent protease